MIMLWIWHCIINIIYRFRVFIFYQAVHRQLSVAPSPCCVVWSRISSNRSVLSSQEGSIFAWGAGLFVHLGPHLSSWTFFFVGYFFLFLGTPTDPLAYFLCDIWVCGIWPYQFWSLVPGPPIASLYQMGYSPQTSPVKLCWTHIHSWNLVALSAPPVCKL